MKKVTAFFTLGPLALLLGLALVLAPLPAFAQGDVEAQLEAIKARLAELEAQSADAAGREIYNAACATCHGYNGDGNGPEADGFRQPATIFTDGIYKFRSTLSEIPTTADLERSIRVGMPGTEMVPFKHILSDRSIRAVAHYIKSFSVEYDMGAQPAEDASVDLPDERPQAATPQSIAEGEALWADMGCGDCHGARGQGLPSEDDWGRSLHLLDFRQGVFKSGPHDTDLYRSIATGMYGSTMPAYAEDLSDEEIWQLVDYVRSLEDKPTGFIARAWHWLFVEDPSGFDYSDY